jgi:uncharacterized Fe-S radical SAM superfamily protein PflX
MPGAEHAPSYLELADRGELQARAARAQEMLRACNVCARCCGVNRLAGELGACRTGEEAVISSSGPHFGEEAPLVGVRGSGTIFPPPAGKPDQLQPEMRLKSAGAAMSATRDAGSP